MTSWSISPRNLPNDQRFERFDAHMLRSCGNMIVWRHAPVLPYLRLLARRQRRGIGTTHSKQYSSSHGGVVNLKRTWVGLFFIFSSELSFVLDRFAGLPERYVGDRRREQEKTADRKKVVGFLVPWQPQNRPQKVRFGSQKQIKYSDRKPNFRCSVHITTGYAADKWLRHTHHDQNRLKPNLGTVVRYRCIRVILPQNDELCDTFLANRAALGVCF